MSLPNQFPGSKSYCIVVGGDINDPDQQKLSLLKVFDPLRHGSQISPQELPHVGIERPATQACLEQFNAPPEQGTVVVSTFNMGDPTSRTAVGMPTEYNSAENVGGNSGLYEILNLVSQISSRKNIKPQIIEKVVNGVLVREKQEKGQEWRHDLTKGLATHAAWHPMAGQLLNEVKNIETAIQNFANIPNAGALSQLPGSIMNIASLFKGLNNKQRKQATKNMPPLLIQGLENMILLSSDVSGGSQYVSSNRINPEVFTQNMIDLLSQVDNISDLIDAIHRLQYDVTLRGLEEYSKKANTGLIIETVYSNEDNEYSTINLSADVEKSIHYFDDGYSLNVSNKTYVVLSADQSSNTINVFPKMENDSVNTPVNIYLPVIEYQTEGPYGEMTMTMDMNGNVSPNKNSAQQLQQALQAIQSIISSVQGGNKNLFGDAAGIMGQLFNRIPNNIRSLVINSIGQGMQQGPNEAHKKLLAGLIPHV